MRLHQRPRDAADLQATLTVIDDAKDVRIPKAANVEV